MSHAARAVCFPNNNVIINHFCPSVTCTPVGGGKVDVRGKAAQPCVGHDQWMLSPPARGKRFHAARLYVGACSKPPCGVVGVSRMKGPNNSGEIIKRWVGGRTPGKWVVVGVQSVN